MGIALERIEAVKQREYNRLAMKSYVYEQTSEGKKRVDLVPGVRERILQERTRSALAGIKPKIIEQFSAPQFAFDWIALAEKTNAPFSRLFVVYFESNEWRKYKK
jgi:hypothetical protein